MITKFKIYENLNTPPKVGDYVSIYSIDLPNEPEYIDEKIYFFGKTKEDVINQVDIYNKVKKYNI